MAHHWRHVVFAAMAAALALPATGVLLAPAKSPILFCPAQLSVGADYEDFFALLEGEYGRQVVCADLSRTDWLRLAPSIATPAYWQGALTPSPVLDFYFEALDRAVARYVCWQSPLQQRLWHGTNQTDMGP